MRAVLVCTLGLFLAGISTPTRATGPVHLWSERFGGALMDESVTVAVDPSGNVIVSGRFQGTANFGGGNLVSGGGFDIFLAKYDANGVHLWSKSFSASSNQRVIVVTADPFGNIVLTGNSSGAVSLGGAPVGGSGSFDIIVAKYDLSGAHLWSKGFGSAGGNDSGWDVATDATGAIALTGYFTNTVNLGGATFVSMGSSDMFVVKFDSSGAHQWSRRFGDSGADQGVSVEFDGAGNLIMLSQFAGSVDFGGGPLASSGTYDVALAKFDTVGSHLWSKHFGGASSEFAAYVARDNADNIYLGALIQGNGADFGGGPLTHFGSDDVVLAKYDPSGAHLWSHSYGGARSDVGQTVAVDNAGNVAMIGNYYGTADFGSGFDSTDTSWGNPSSDIFLALYDTNGVPQWSATFGDSLQDFGYSVAMAGVGTPVITGVFAGSVDFGGGPLTSAGSFDVFVAKFDVDHPVPVAISSFTAAASSRGVELAWRFSSDETVIGFTVYRSRGEGPVQVIAAGDAATHSSFDASVAPGETYRYQLVIRTTSGNEFRSQFVTTTVPSAVASLGQNFPNPFNPRTSIEYTVGTEGSVSIDIFDVTGKRIRSLPQGVRRPGTYRVEWNGLDANGHATGSGVYFYRLGGAKSSETRKMLLLK
jgi:hypothetical protein